MLMTKSYYYYTHLAAFFQENLDKSAPAKVNHSRFYWSKRWWRGSGISWTICNHSHFTSIITIGTIMSCMQCLLGHVECRDDAVCTEHCTTMEVEAITQCYTERTAIEQMNGVVKSPRQPANTRKWLLRWWRGCVFPWMTTSSTTSLSWWNNAQVCVSMHIMYIVFCILYGLFAC